MFGKKKKALDDVEVIEGLQQGDSRVEHDFYMSCRSYFNQRRSGVMDIPLDNAQLPEDLFQDSFEKLWIEIRSKKIYIRDNYPWRVDRTGEPRRMTANLHTYLMAIAKYRNYEMIREEEIYVHPDNDQSDKPDDDLPDFTHEEIVEQCVNALPPRCKDILTLFYYEMKSLDEILAIRHENTSKDGLKSGKSKCMAQLKKRILEQFERYHLKPYSHA